MCKGLGVVTSVLYAFEFLLSAILIHWESKAMCRTHFNTLVMYKNHLHSFKIHLKHSRDLFTVLHKLTRNKKYRKYLKRTLYNRRT